MSGPNSKRTDVSIEYAPLPVDCKPDFSPRQPQLQLKCCGSRRGLQQRFAVR
jgi:hypothetical protein